MQQKYAQLVELSEFPFPIYSSANTEQQARRIAVHCQQALDFLSTIFRHEAQIKVLVLTPEHWQTYATEPVYGMPHFINTQTIVVAGQNNDFWRSMLPTLDALPPQLTEAMEVAYGQPDGSFDLAPFFDLTAVHEMGHLFHVGAAIEFPRFWLMELFCNLCMHAYVATCAPEQLLALVTFPQVFLAQGYSQYPYHTLDNFEYVLAVSMSAQNYVWYECQLCVAAQHIYEAGGVETLQRLWNTFKGSKETLSNQQLALRLHEQVHPEVERVLTHWLI